jgi:hypothetical protein
MTEPAKDILQVHHSGKARFGNRGYAWIALIAAATTLPHLAPTCLGETEPNGTIGAADLIRQGEFGQGAINPIADVDYWRASGADIGDIVFAMVDTQNSTMSTQSDLRIFAADGTTLIGAELVSGNVKNTIVAGAIVPQAGNVYMQVSEDTFDGPDVITSYDIYQAVIDPADTAAGSEPNNTPATAAGIPTMMTTGSVVHLSGDVDYYKFRAETGARLVVMMDEDPGGGGVMHSIVAIYDTDGTTLLVLGDNLQMRDDNAAGAVFAPSTGTYFIFVSSGGAGDADYRFVVFVNGVPYSDSDGDLFADTDDNCPTISNATQLDGDGDGVGNSCDNCAASILKAVGPADCGCDEPDVDINGDGASDCGLADPALSLLSSFGLLLVTDATNHRIMAFDPADGDLVDPDFIPEDAVNLPNPANALLGPNQDTILVSDTNADVVQQYDLDGNYLGVFAPAGGADTMILESPLGMAWRPNGNLVVGVTAGPNADAVAEFDSDGNYVGNFITANLGGLVDPRDIMFHAGGSVLVAKSFGDTIRRYDAVGSFVSNFATNPGGFSVQLAEASNGNVYVANSLGARRGVVRFTSDGTFVAQHAPSSICNFIGLAELSNGNWLITGQPLITGGTTIGGAFEMNAAGDIVRTILRGPGLGAVEYVLRDADGDGVGDDLDGCPNDPAKTSEGACGCGMPETDADGNGTPDCLDAAPPPPPGPQPEPGCCAPGVFPTVGFIAPMILVGWMSRRRRRRHSA